MSKFRHQKAKQRAAFLGGFSLVAAQKLRQCLEQAKQQNFEAEYGCVSTPLIGEFTGKLLSRR